MHIEPLGAHWVFNFAKSDWSAATMLRSDFVECRYIMLCTVHPASFVVVPGVMTFSATAVGTCIYRAVDRQRS